MIHCCFDGGPDQHSQTHRPEQNHTGQNKSTQASTEPYRPEQVHTGQHSQPHRQAQNHTGQNRTTHASKEPHSPEQSATQARLLGTKKDVFLQNTALMGLYPEKVFQASRNLYLSTMVSIALLLRYLSLVA